MMLKTVIVSDKGQVSIPVDVRRMAGIERGDELILVQEDSRILLEKTDKISKSIRDDFKDLMKHSEKTAKKLWSNKKDEIWNNI